MTQLLIVLTPRDLEVVDPAFASPLILQLDWNDSHTTHPRRSFNYHTPCYYMTFPPRVNREMVVDDVTNATIEVVTTQSIVHCYTVYGVALYVVSAFMFFFCVLGSIAFVRNAMDHTYKALASSDWFDLFLHQHKKYMEVQAEVNRFTAKQIIKHQMKQDGHFFGLWWEKVQEAWLKVSLHSCSIP